MSHVAAFLCGGCCVAAVMWFLGGRDIAKCKRAFEAANKRHVESIEELERLATAKKGPRK